jgi:hypothetical protein
MVSRKSEKVPGHKLIQLLNKPNAFYGEAQLWMGTIFSWCTAETVSNLEPLRVAVVEVPVLTGRC